MFTYALFGQMTRPTDDEIAAMLRKMANAMLFDRQCAMDNRNVTDNKLGASARAMADQLQPPKQA